MTYTLPAAGRRLSGRRYPSQLVFEVPLSLGPGSVSGETGLWTIEDLTAYAAAQGNSVWRGQLQPRSYATNQLPNAAANEGMIVRDATIGLPVLAADGEWSPIQGRLYSLRSLFVGNNPGDFPTLSAAIGQAVNFRRGYPDEDTPFVKITIRSGYEIQEAPITLKDSDFSAIEIHAEDAVVNVDAAALSQAANDRLPGTVATSLFQISGARAPRFAEFKFRLTGIPIMGILCSCWVLNPGSSLIMSGRSFSAEDAPGRPVGCENFSKGVEVRNAALIAARAEYNNNSTGVLALEGSSVNLNLVNAYGNTENGIVANFNSNVVVIARDVAADFPAAVVPYFGNFRCNATTPLSGADDPSDIEARSGAAILLAEAGTGRAPILGGSTPPRAEIGGRDGGAYVASNLNDDILTWTGWVRPRSYTPGTLPAAADNPGVVLWDSVNNRLVVSDGTGWRAIDTTAI